MYNRTCTKKYVKGVLFMEEKLDVFNSGNKKLPRCVAVYDKLFEMIKEGEFSRITQLPSEPELAKIMGVSRMTLRQALSLLQEDGIVKNIRGKGNFITRTEVFSEKGLEILDHPLYTSITEKIDSVELEFKLEPSTEYTNKILERKSPVVVFVDRWYKSQDKIVAYTLSIIPIETIVEKSIDLNEKENLIKFLEKEVYEEATHSSIKLNFSSAGNFSSMKNISDSKKFYLLGETLYYKNKYPVLHNKHYIPIEYGNITVERKRK